MKNEYISGLMAAAAAQKGTEYDNGRRISGVWPERLLSLPMIPEYEPVISYNYNLTRSNTKLYAKLLMSPA